MPSYSWMDSVDHREPIWREGRDYQLVCGFETEPLNQRIISVGENSRKSNRFVPWRIDSDSIPPNEKGDLAWFLNMTTLEWEFIEWLGERWFELTKQHCGGYYAGINNKGKPYTRNPELPSNFVEYHKRRKEDPSLNEKHSEVCRQNGKLQGSINGRKNKGRKHSPEVNSRKGSPGEKNGMFGKIRITNGERNTQINHGDPIPEGWRLGMTRFKNLTQTN